MLGFVLRVVAALPPRELAGLLRKDPPGENIANYRPGSCWVRVNRVCYPDGTIYKILEDAGPGGANKPAWNGPDTVAAKFYVPVGADVPARPPAEPPPAEHEEEPGPVDEAPPVTYDEFVKGDHAYVEQIARALVRQRGNYALSDIAHFSWQLLVERATLQQVLDEIDP